MHAARAARLRPAAQPELLQQRLHLQRDAADIGPRDAGAGIEIDAQLVGMIEIGGAHRMRMQLDAAEIDDPGEAGGVVDDDLFRGSAGGKRERDGSQPGGRLSGRALLVERLALRAVDETLQHDRTIADAGERARRDRQIVAHEIELCELRFAREVGLLRVRDAHLAPFDGNQFDIIILGHGDKLKWVRSLSLLY